MNSDERQIVRRKRGVVLSAPGLERLRSAIANLEAQQNNANPYSAEELSSLTGVSPSTIRRLRAAKSGIDQRSLQQIFNALNLELQESDFQWVDRTDAELAVEALAQPFPTAQTYRYPSGPLPLASPLYIVRSPIEQLASQEITQPGCVVRIKAPPQFGKSSLLLRILHQAQQLGYATAAIDLQQVGDKILSDCDRFLQWFCATLALKLGVDANPATAWNQLVGSQLSATLFVREQVLRAVNRPVLLAINDIGRLFEHPATAQGFLPLLRSWYEEAGHDALWQHLRLVVTYSTDSYLPLDINYSPFNIGLALALPEFTAAQVLELARVYGLDWGDCEADQLLALMGGHPSLVHGAIYHLSRELLTFDELLQTASTAQGIYSGHLQKLLATMRSQPHLGESLRSLVQGGGPIPLEPMQAYQLEGTGLVKGSAEGWQISRELYRQYFQQVLSLPQNWLLTR
ncbi:AAA-like domain-containing protein [Nodosilinea sp. LEGE 06152]|uniref:AAA-like domain-containing protein n=1 Tax=Nodosilinea sp. LEGE 06152 TaxID=2777966 RepID=UPI0018821690|nr:AAA-like domain-containing protein [Nodosilinea sp. LEGE 06152]MBE9157023.1 AAA-like domain-containing protein [Nodosilinea sp. LEGE 06152]